MTFNKIVKRPKRFVLSKTCRNRKATMVTVAQVRDFYKNLFI